MKTTFLGLRKNKHLKQTEFKIKKVIKDKRP